MFPSSKAALSVTEVPGFLLMVDYFVWSLVYKEIVPTLRVRVGLFETTLCSSVLSVIT